MKKSKIPWTKLSSKIAYKNPWIKIREDQVIKPNGKKGLYGVILTPPAVFVIPITAKNETYIIKLFRYPTQMYSWEVPAGSSDGENILRAAKRELQEETGLLADKWTKAGEFQSFNGCANEISHTFIAKDLKKTKKNRIKEEGIIEIKKVSFKQIFKMIKTGELNDAQSITAIIQAAGYLKII